MYAHSRAHIRIDSTTQAITNANRWLISIAQMIMTKDSIMMGWLKYDCVMTNLSMPRLWEEDIRMIMVMNMACGIHAYTHGIIELIN